MIEAMAAKTASEISNAGEIAKVGGSEFKNKDFDPDKRVDVGKNSSSAAEKTFDLDRRVDLEKNPVQVEEKEAKFNPDKAISREAENANAGIEKNQEMGDNEKGEGEKIKNGGSYRELKNAGHGEATGEEVHHMPANSTTELPTDDGPAIAMDKEDHRKTASCGSSKEAREYQEKQKELIEKGKFLEALRMDIDDIHEKFGDKYDDAIDEMLEYVDKLEKEGKI